MTLDQVATLDQIDQAIDQYIRQDPVRAFHNLNLNIILHALNKAVAGGIVAGESAGAMQRVISSDFDTTTHVQLAPVFAGQNVEVFFQEQQRYLLKGDNGDPNEVSVDPLGGFTVLIPGFDATTANYHFYAYIAI